MTRLLLAVVTALGAAAAAAGLWFTRADRSASFGWTAYSPLSETTPVILLGPPWWSLALLALGSATLGVAATVLVLRRRVRPDPGQVTSGAPGQVSRIWSGGRAVSGRGACGRRRG